MSEPRTLGKYEILDVLGEGGMGTVYRALDSVLERVVAIKLLHRDSSPESADGWNRFLNEARAIARLNHPAIVSVYEFVDKDPNEPYFVMEYVDGSMIDEYVWAKHAPVAVTLELMTQLLTGLAYAHRQGVVHRDIKPSNLLVTRDGRLKITDFGIAKIGEIKQTKTGLMIGTPAYMAPERYTGGVIDPRCDVYSTGVLCYELLTTRRPFQGELTEIIYQICHVAPSLMSATEPSVPALLDAVIAKALAKNPAERYETAETFHAAIESARETLGLAARGLPSPGPPALAGPAAVTMPSTRPAADAPAAWSAAEINDIVQELTPILGPLARVVVKRNAALTRDRGQMFEAIARQLRTDEERRRFLSAVIGAGKRTLPPGPGASLGAERIVAHEAIAPSTLERTIRILSRYIGPIATVVVKKTAASAADESDLYARLAERIANAEERARFVADLKRG